MTNFSTTGSTDGAAFTDAERWEVVVEHEFLRVFLRKPVNPLLITGGSEGHGDQRLCFASLENGTAVYPRQDVNMAFDGSERLAVATVWASAGENQVTDNVFFEIMPLLGEVRRANGIFRIRIRNRFSHRSCLQC